MRGAEVLSPASTDSISYGKANRGEAIQAPYLPDVPMIRYVDLGRLHTAGHELNHAIAALSLGMPPVSISVEPDGDSLGRTTFAGSMDPRIFQIIAAAGSIDTPTERATGFGSDIAKAHMLGSLAGMSVDSAQHGAHAAVNSYSPEVRMKAAEIIAYYRVVSGSMLQEILRRAEYETKLENGIFVDLTINENFEKEQSGDRKDSTEIDYLQDGSYKLRYVNHEGKIIKEAHICGACYGINAHAFDCPLVMRDKTYLSQSGVIVSF